MAENGAFPSLNGVKVLYEDNHLLAVEKAIGLAVQGAAGVSDTLLDRLKEGLRLREHKPGAVFLAPVHRLDQPVGGVLLLAKTSKAAARLSEQLRRGAFEKEYLACCTAVPRIPAARLEHLLIKDRRSNHSRVVAAQSREADLAKRACLDYRVLATDARKGLALLELRLGSGRSHQIRVQLAHIGCPIWGDYRYNPAWARAKKGDSVALWARRLRFAHPVGGRTVCVEARLPASRPWLEFAEFI